MNSFEKLKNHHDQLRSEVDITPFLEWYDTRIALWQRDIIDQPQHAASFRQLIKADREAKQRMIEKHSALQIRVSMQLMHEEMSIKTSLSLMTPVNADKGELCSMCMECR